MFVRAAPSTAAPHARAGTRIARQVASTAVIVLVLGVLPIAWHASVVWQIVGGAVSVVLVLHTARSVWHEVFGTDPGHHRD
jgi:hypothetical protein